MDEFPQYVAAQLHCHSSIEGPASIGAHCYEAKRAGVDVVWLTDHDTRISLCIGGPFVDRFDFESPELLTSVERKAPGGRSVQRGVGWSIARRDERLAKGSAALTREQCYRGTQSLCLEAVAGSADASLDQVGQQSGDEWQYLEVEFKAEGKIHSRPLLSDVTIGIAVRLEAVSSTDAEAWLDLLLSEQPPDLRSGRLRYTFTPPLAPEDDSARFHTKIVPLTCPTGAWVRHELRPADEAAGDGLGGGDNAITGVRLGVRVRPGGHVRLYVDDLTVTHQFSGNALHARQRALARELGATHGVVCHVAQEISQAGQHKNAWGEGVPLLDYLGQPSGFSHEEGVEWARRHNAVFSLNHPFSKYAKPEIDDVMRDQILAELVDTYASSGASGANTLEVGFPAGRHQFDLEYYLRLWDELSLRGVIITGSASSDAHSARVGWQRGNNFATYIRADGTDEASLLAGLRSGNVYLADPVRFRSRVRFMDATGHRMGQVVQTDQGVRQEVRLVLDRSQPGWHMRWVVNGERRPPVELGEGLVDQRLGVQVKEPVFVRAEIWDSRYTSEGDERTGDDGTPGRGRCVMLTNPIWYVPGDLPPSVSPERRA